MNPIRLTTLLTALSVPLLAVSAHAQDAGAPMPEAAATTTAATGDDPDWRAHTYRGAYVSGAVGWANGANGSNNKFYFDRNNDGNFGDTVVTAGGGNAFSGGFCRGYYASTIPGDCRPDRNRAEWALRAGYDARMGNLVSGIVLEGTKNGSRDATSAFGSDGNAYRITRGIDYGVALRGRIGWTPNGGGLFYVTSGVAYGRMKHIFRTTNTANSFAEVNPDKWRWGVQLGAGAEVMVTPKVSLGLEWLYNRYRDSDYYVAVTQGTAGAASPFVLAGGQTNMRASRNYEFNTFRGTLSYHF